MRASGDVHSAVDPGHEVNSQLVVDGALVLSVGSREHGDEVLELADDSLDLGRSVLAGRRLPADLSAIGVFRRCASKWWHRYLDLGVDGLHDRFSRPARSIRRLPERVEAKIVRRRRSEKVGPDRPAIHLDLPTSTIYRVLRRRDVHRLSHLDRQTAQPIRRSRADLPAPRSG